MSKAVKITPAKKTAKLVNPYESNPEFGFMVVTQKNITISNGWARPQVRTALIKGPVDVLKEMVADAGEKLELDGKIIVLEYLEDEIPEDIKKKFFNEDDDEDEQIENYIKRSGEDGIELTFEGTRIVRFQEYSYDDTSKDILISHDNTAEVSAYAKLQKEENANLPG